MPGEQIHVISAVHEECGAESQVRLPASVPAEIVSTLVCVECGRRYARLQPPAPAIEEVPEAVVEVIVEEPVVQVVEEAVEEPIAAIVEEVVEAPIAPIEEEIVEEPVVQTVDEVAAEPITPIVEEVVEEDEPSSEEEIRADGPALNDQAPPTTIRLIPVTDPTGEHAGFEQPQTRRGIGLPRLSSRLGQLAMLPIIVVLILLGLKLAQGSGGDQPSARPTAGAATAPAQARFLKRANYSLALPSGWKTARPEPGATMRAVAPGKQAEATLWIERNPRLSFKAFERRSLRHLNSLADNARVFQRVAAPTGEGTIVQMRADVPAGKKTSPYLVSLRAAGPYRYYLATSVEPDASNQVRKSAALIHGSFIPEGSDG